MGLVTLLPLLVAVGVVLWFWLRPVIRGTWWRSAGWFAGTAVLLGVVLGCVYFVGAFAGGLDPEEACHADGERYDRDYRHEHVDEDLRWFPLSDPCHVGYDLVPGWVNPTLVVLAILAVGCLGTAVWLLGRAFVRRRTKVTVPSAKSR